MIHRRTEGCADSWESDVDDEYKDSVSWMGSENRQRNSRPEEREPADQAFAAAPNCMSKTLDVSSKLSLDGVYTRKGCYLTVGVNTGMAHGLMLRSLGLRKGQRNSTYTPAWQGHNTPSARTKQAVSGAVRLHVIQIEKMICKGVRGHLTRMVHVRNRLVDRNAVCTL